MSKQQISTNRFSEETDSIIQEEIQTHLNELRVKCDEYGLVINPHKSRPGHYTIEIYPAQ